MSAKPAVSVARREVPLSKRGHRLVLDVQEGVFRVAYYRPKLVTGTRKLMAPPPGREQAEERRAAKAERLVDVLRVLFTEADEPFDPVTVEHYLRSTSWGSELP